MSWNSSLAAICSSTPDRPIASAWLRGISEPAGRGELHASRVSPKVSDFSRPRETSDERRRQKLLIVDQDIPTGERSRFRDLASAARILHTPIKYDPSHQGFAKTPQRCQPHLMFSRTVKRSSTSHATESESQPDARDRFTNGSSGERAWGGPSLLCRWPGRRENLVCEVDGGKIVLRGHVPTHSAGDAVSGMEKVCGVQDRELA